MSASKPVILCGRTKKIAEVVITNLKPEMDVIHLCLSTEAACEQIPRLLDGGTAPSNSEHGSKDYSKPPGAVILGAGFNDADASRMMAACEASKVKVPWLRPDASKPTPPLGPEYGKALVHRIKELMEELDKQESVKENTVVWY